MTACASFPLTPALSLREREPYCPSWCKVEALGYIARRDTILPLPKGEGWGEGKGAVRCHLACGRIVHPRICFT